MDSIRWGHGWQEMAICARRAVATLPPINRGGADDHEWQPVSIRSVDRARAVLEPGEEQVRKLRHLLAAATGADKVWRLSDHQVIDEVADKLANRQLVLFKKVRSVDAKAPATASAPAAPAVAAAGASPTTTSIKRRPSPVAAPPAQPAPAPPQTAPMSASLDQDAQATTLRLAAKDGTPFCEVCERRKRELAEAARQREAA